MAAAYNGSVEGVVNMGNIMTAFLLALFAGLSTTIGGLAAFAANQENKKFFAVSLGFSAGVMIYVSMIEIFMKAKTALTTEMGNVLGSWVTVAAFFGGMVLIACIDRLISKEENPHELKTVDDEPKKLMQMGIFTAFSIALHNFPEGLATFVSAMQEPSVALPIVFAVAIHNIPEGIAVSVPVYQATGSKSKALWYSFVSGLAEPVGALAGWLVLIPIMTDTVYGMIFAAVAGIMVFISLDELLPAAMQYGEHHISIYGMMSGMMVMAVSLLLFL